MSNANEEVAERLGLNGNGAPTKGWLAWPRAHPFLAGGLALFFALIVWLMFFRGSSGVTYVSEPVTRGELKVLVTATGTVEPETSVAVGSEISGRIDKVNAEFNDKVTKGQSLLNRHDSAKNAVAHRNDA